MRYITTVNGNEYLLDLVDDHHVTVNGVPYEIDFEGLGDQPVYSLLADGKSYSAHVYQEENTWQVIALGQMYVARVEDERERRLRASLAGTVPELYEFHLKAPMPGLVVAVPVTVGQHVEKGTVLLILESMKMQNELRAPRSGTIARLRVAPGDRVENKETLMSVV